MRRYFYIGVLSYTTIVMVFFAAFVSTGFLLYYSSRKLQAFDFAKSAPFNKSAQFTYNTSRILAPLVKPLLIITNTNTVIERGLDIEKNTINTIESAVILAEQIKSKKNVVKQIEKTSYQLSQLHESIPSSITQLTSTKEEIKKALLLLDGLRIFYQNSDGEYLVFFLNDRELRPGGGFIGSIGWLSLNNLEIDSLNVEDAYEIDGKLQTHHEPPYPVRTYLELPNWYLRDSNFSPDFVENVRVAETFLEDSIGKRSYKGSIGLTTHAVLGILDTIGPVYVPDYKLTITKDNFYETTQRMVERNFFPGSRQKRNFLSSLTTAIRLKLEDQELLQKKLLVSIIRSLDTKHIIVSSKQKALHKTLATLGWTGEVAKPVFDYIYPVDANVGANKVNTYIKRKFQSNITFTKTHVAHTFSIRYKNDSPIAPNPGETYKNYLQIYLAKNADVSSVSVNGNPVEVQRNNLNQHKIVGLYLEVEPQKESIISLTYKLPLSPNKQKKYQLIVQKQIGSTNNEYELKVKNNSYSLTTPLEKDFLFSFDIM
ncbi:MAG: DUF4012 domain-containing protein [Patescibacteria group bacterium]